MAMWEPVQDTEELLAARVKPHDHGPAIEGTTASGSHRRLFRHYALRAALRV